MFNSFSVGVTLRNNIIESIAYSCILDEHDPTSLNGIKCGDSGEEILRKFRTDVRVLCAVKAKQAAPWSQYEQLRRVFDVVRYGTRYYLSQNIVTNIEVASPETLRSSVGIDWDKCQ